MVKWFDLVIKMILGENFYWEMRDDYPKLQGWKSNPWNSRLLAVEVGGRRAATIKFINSKNEKFILHINERYAWKDFPVVVTLQKVGSWQYLWETGSNPFHQGNIVLLEKAIQYISHNGLLVEPENLIGILKGETDFTIPEEPPIVKIEILNISEDSEGIHIEVFTDYGTGMASQGVHSYKVKTGITNPNFDLLKQREFSEVHMFLMNLQEYNKKLAEVIS